MGANTTAYFLLADRRRAAQVAEAVSLILESDPQGCVAVFDDAGDPMPEGALELHERVAYRQRRGVKESPGAAAVAALASLPTIFPRATHYRRCLPHNPLGVGYTIKAGDAKRLAELWKGRAIPGAEFEMALKSLPVGVELIGLPAEFQIPTEKDYAEFRRDGYRLEPVSSDPLRVDAIMTVATGRVAGDLERFLTTACYHHPGVPIYVICDEEAYHAGLAITRGSDVFGGGFYLPHITEKNSRDWLDHADLIKHAAYWQPGAIAWKMKGALALYDLGRVQEGQGLLVADSDIVFNGDARAEEFPGCDCALSPGYCWADRRTGERDTWLNAGMVLARRRDFWERWLALYRRGIGEFYEQGCLQWLLQEYRCGFFSWRHNWGSWRAEQPHDALSLHIRATMEHSHLGGKALQAEARKAFDRAKAGLLARRDATTAEEVVALVRAAEVDTGAPSNLPQPMLSTKRRFPTRPRDRQEPTRIQINHAETMSDNASPTGIKETSELLVALITGAKTAHEVMADGKVNLADAARIAAAGPALLRGFLGIQHVDDEVRDLDAGEVARLSALVTREAGDLPEGYAKKAAEIFADILPGLRSFLGIFAKSGEGEGDDQEPEVRKAQPVTEGAIDAVEG